MIQPGKMWARTRGITSIAYLVLIGLLSCVYSGYLFYVSAFELDTFCIYCVALYTVNLGATGLAVWSAPVGFGDLLKDGMSRVFRIQEPMVSSALVFLVAVGLSYTVYQDKLGEMLVPASTRSTTCSQTRNTKRKEKWRRSLRRLLRRRPRLQNREQRQRQPR